MNWVDSAQDKDYWKALVNAALKLQFPYSVELLLLVGNEGNVNDS